MLRAIVHQGGNPDDHLFLPDFITSRSVAFALNKDEPRLEHAIRAALEIEASSQTAKRSDARFDPGSQQPR